MEISRSEECCLQSSYMCVTTSNIVVNDRCENTNFTNIFYMCFSIYCDESYRTRTQNIELTLYGLTFKTKLILTPLFYLSDTQIHYLWGDEGLM